MGQGTEKVPVIIPDRPDLPTIFWNISDLFVSSIIIFQILCCRLATRDD